MAGAHVWAIGTGATAHAVTGSEGKAGLALASDTPATVKAALDIRPAVPTGRCASRTHRNPPGRRPPCSSSPGPAPTRPFHRRRRRPRRARRRRDHHRTRRRPHPSHRHHDHVRTSARTIQLYTLLRTTCHPIPGADPARTGASITDAPTALDITTTWWFSPCPEQPHGRRISRGLKPAAPPPPYAPYPARPIPPALGTEPTKHAVPLPCRPAVRSVAGSRGP